jgi:hypothetical protein
VITSYLTMARTRGNKISFSYCGRSSFIRRIWWCYLTSFFNRGTRLGEQVASSWTSTTTNLNVNGVIVPSLPQRISWAGLKDSLTVCKTRESAGFVCHELWAQISPTILLYEQTFADISVVLGGKFTPSECSRGAWRNLNLSEWRDVIRLIAMRPSGEAGTARG